ATRAKAIVKATTHFQDAAIIAEVSKALGIAMPGIDIKTIPPEQLLATRGW
ncbi:MAG: pyridoxal 5'-phosphate synthase lyase subunit PdxS, partial [Dehalococcoidia bacterium]